MSRGHYRKNSKLDCFTGELRGQWYVGKICQPLDNMEQATSGMGLGQAGWDKRARLDERRTGRTINGQGRSNGT